jgi:hypothetical protein
MYPDLHHCKGVKFSQFRFQTHALMYATGMFEERCVFDRLVPITSNPDLRSRLQAAFRSCSLNLGGLPGSR